MATVVDELGHDGHNDNLIYASMQSLTVGDAPVAAPQLNPDTAGQYQSLIDVLPSLTHDRHRLCPCSYFHTRQH